MSVKLDFFLTCTPDRSGVARESLMSKVFIFAGIAALGNAVFVYGQRSASVSPNPFLYMSAAIFVCLVMFVAATLVSSNGEFTNYLAKNRLPIIIGGVGFFITFVGFYLMYSRVGANSYAVYACLSILTTSVGVGILIFREPYNQHHIIAIILAILAVCFYGYGQYSLDAS